jgi:glycosyltransferase involved in cell wall biosynthesis
MNVILVRGRATDPAVNKIAKSLSQNGYNVKLLVWDRQNTLKVKNDEGYEICRFKFKAPSDKLMALFYLPIWWIYEIFFLLKEDCNVIHTCDLDTLVPAILVKLVKRVKLCYIIYDFYADNLADGKFILLRKHIRSLVASIEKFGIRFVEILFLVDKSRYQEVEGAKINNLVYIYNSPPDYFDVKQEKESRDAEIQIIIFYAGNITKFIGLQYMIKAVQDLDNVKLIMSGPIGDNELIEKSISQSGKIQYLGWLPTYKDVIKKTLEADILFRFSDPKVPKSKYASPNKLFEAMMCEKPIIVTDDTSMANIVREENCGLVVSYGDIDAIKEAIIKLKNNPDLRQRLGKNGRRAYEEKYSWDIMEKRLINAYKKIKV